MRQVTQQRWAPPGPTPWWCLEAQQLHRMGIRSRVSLLGWGGLGRDAPWEGRLEHAEARPGQVLCARQGSCPRAWRASLLEVRKWASHLPHQPLQMSPPFFSSCLQLGVSPCTHVQLMAGRLHKLQTPNLQRDQKLPEDRHGVTGFLN